MTTRAATGSRSLLGLGLGRTAGTVGEYGIPAGALVGYNHVLPLEATLGGAESASGEVNPLGYRRAGIPGPKGGPLANVGIPMITGNLLELLEHIFGSVTKDEPVTDVFTYEFGPTLDGVDTSFWALVAQKPVDIFALYGIKFAQMVTAIGDNTPLVPRLSGMVQHGTRLSPAVPAVANTGTYVLGPWIRGLAAAESAGSIWVRVTSVSPLQYKVIQSVAAPDGAAWTAAATAYDQELDSALNGIWQNLRSSEDELDLGLYDENKDPLELVFPGAAADHADLVVDDTFEFQMPGAWTAPAITALSGPRFTSAHWITRFRAIGAPAYATERVRTGGITWAWPVEADRGNNSRYPHEILRAGEFAPSITLARSFVSRFFVNLMDRHAQLDVQLAFEGRQLDADHREGLVATYPAAKLTERASNPAAAGVTEETATLVGETNDAGDAPCTVVVTTDRDWTPST
jgi:hypothetical protein